MPRKCPAPRLRPWRGDDDGRIFPKRPSHHTLKRDLGCAGISPHKRCFHSFRKSLATEMTRAGVPMAMAQKQTRHRSSAVFANSYVDTAASDLRDALKKVQISLAGAGGMVDIAGARSEPDSDSHGNPTSSPPRSGDPRVADGNSRRPGHRPGQVDVSGAGGNRTPGSQEALLLLLEAHIRLIRLVAPDEG